MKQRWPISVAILVLLMAVAFTGCENKDVPNANQGDQLTMKPVEPAGTVPVTPAKQGKKIALVMKTLTNPFFLKMEKGARKAEQELGVELIVKTGASETSVEQQITIISDMTEQKVGAIVIAPADSARLIPSLKKAQDAGIVIVNIDNRLSADIAKNTGLINVPFISVDNVKGGYLSAQYVSGKIKKPTQAAIIEGIRGARNAEDRKKGALMAFNENPNIKVVAMETANWKIDEGFNVAARIFKDYPEITLVFCANDMMAFGVLQYLEKKEGKEKVLIASYDALDDAMRDIRAGKLQATVDQQAELQGYMGVKTAVRLLNKEEVNPEVIVDVKLVTRENL
jgi:ribose transport system substrate-binding protein